MEVKKEPVDHEYNEEGHPPDDGWYHVPIVKPEALETFEGASHRIKSEFQTDIEQPIFKEEVAPRESTVNCRDSENNEESTSFASDLKNQGASLRIKSEFQTDIGQPIFKEEVGLRVCGAIRKVSKNDEESTSFASERENQGASFRIKSEFQTNIGQPIFKEEVGLKVCEVNCKVSENDEESTSFASELKNEIPDADSSTLLPYDIEIDEIDVKKEVVGHRPIVVVINLQKKVFHERNFVCSICLQLFASFDSLSLHKSVHHKFILMMGNFEPASQRYEFDFESANRVVIKTRKFKYSDGKLFENKNWDSKNVYNHKLLQTGNNKIDCLKSASTSYLRPHMLHTDKNLFKYGLFGFKTHKLSHTDEKRYKCNICDYKSADKARLNAHKVTHTGEKPFKCDLCDFKYAHKSRIYYHKLSHTIEKPFKCDQCDYKSAHKTSLRLHKYSHTGEKRFKCDQCDLRFLKRLYLQRHKTTHTD